MALLFILITAAGFVPSYQDAIAGTFQIHWVAHVHGAILSSWLLLFLAQTALASRGNFKLHRRLGTAAVAVGIAAWIMMGVAYVHLMLVNRPPVDHFFYDLLLGVFYGMACFGLFFSWGSLARKDAAAHKRLLLLATLVILQAGIDRIRWLPMFGMDYPYVFFLYLDALLIPLFVFDVVTLGRVHRVTWIGSAFIIACQLAVSALFGSPRWHRFWFDVINPLL